MNNLRQQYKKQAINISIVLTIPLYNKIIIIIVCFFNTVKY